jgi:beta-glucanase (GH16 family)
MQKLKFLFPLFLFLTFGLYSQCGTLIWQDEFNASTLDNTKWTITTGNGCPSLCGFGNAEAQTYSASSNNVRLENGTLVLEAINSGGNYTSGRITTQGKYSRKYGRYEMRAKLPSGTSLWPAFWMLSDNGNWPRTGEIDIMENRGDQIKQIAGTLHYGDYVPNNQHDGTGYTLPTGNFTDSYHIFAVEWELGTIRWYVDGVLYKTETKVPNTLAPASNNDPWPWDGSNFYMILNLAVGSASTPYTGYQAPNFGSNAKFEIDYVRVYDAPQPQLNFLGKVRVYQNTSGQYSIPTGANQTYAWTVPAGATIASGQGTNAINVNWGTSAGGDVQVNVTHNAGAACPGKTFTYTKAVSVYKNDCKFVYQNYQGVSTMSSGYVSGQLYEDNNPGVNAVNNSSRVGRYVRNGAELYDALFYDYALLSNGPDYTSGAYQIKMDVYTAAPVGSQIDIQLGNAAAWGAYPAGIHSTYTATTTVTNQWHTLTFVNNATPDPNRATYQNNLDRLVFLFRPNTNTNNTFYIDNIRREINPAAPALTINGLGAVANNQTGVTYNVTGGNAAHEYLWATPVGSTIASGANTNAISVNYGVLGGIVSVQEKMDVGCYGPVATKSISVGGSSCALFSDEYDNGSTGTWIANSSGAGFTHSEVISDWKINSPGYGEWAYIDYTINDGTNAAMLDFTNPVNNPIMKIRAKASAAAMLRVTFIDNTGKVAANQYLTPLNSLHLTTTSTEYSIDFNGQFWDEYGGGGNLDMSKISKIRIAINPGFASFPYAKPGGGTYNTSFVGDVFIDYIRVGNDCATALANFNANDLVLCGSTSTVTYTDNSSNTNGSTTYAWNFGSGASPATASTKGPHNVTYSTPGWKTVTLTLDGTSTKTRTDYVYVSPANTGCVFQDEYDDAAVNTFTTTQGNFTLTESASNFHIATTAHGEWETFSQGITSLGALMPVDFSCGFSPVIKVRAKASSNVALRLNLVDANNRTTNNAATVAQTMQLTTTYQEFTLNFGTRFTDQYSAGGPFAVDSTNITKMLMSLNPGFSSFPWSGYNTSFNGTVDIDYIRIGNCLTAPTISFTSTNTGVYGTTINLATTSNSTGAITYSVANGTGTATVSGSVLSLTGVGTVTVTATQAAAGGFSGGTQTQVITITKANPTIAFTSSNTGVFGTTINLATTSNSTGAITYTVTNGTGTATVSGSVLSLTGVGTVTVTATQAATANYNGGTQTQVITITKADPTIAFTSTNTGVFGTTINLATTSNSTGAITYTVTNGTGTATVAGSVLSLTGVGTVTVTATQASTANYNGGTQTQVITITKANPTIAFTSTNTGVFGTTINLATTSNSTGAITYTVTNGTGTATVSGSVLSLTGVGTVTVTATQASTANYNGGTQTQVITITKANPTITFTSTNTGVFGTTINLATTSNSTGAITYTVTNGTGTATVSGSVLSLTGVGTVTVTATQATSTNYNGGTQTQVITITKADPTIAFTSANTGVFGTTINLATTSNSTGAITYTVTNGTGTATVSGSVLSLTGVGTVTVTATQASTANYNGGTQTQVITITKANPTITFTSTNTGVFGTTINLATNSNSTGAITYTVTNGTGTATVSGSVLSLTGVGTVTVTATQAASANYNGGTQTQVITITKANPTIAFTSSNTGVFGTTINLATTSNSTGAITYTVTNGTGTATVSGSVLSLTGVGTVTVTATQASTANYNGGTQTQVITITKADPTIAFTSSNTGVFGTTINLATSSNSTGAITYTVTNGTGTANVSGSVLSLTGVGTVTVTATQAASANYNGGTQTQVVTITKANPTIAFTSTNTGVFGTTINLATTSNSTGAITYTVTNGTGSATVSGSVLSLTGVGTVTVTATQASTGNYNGGTLTQVITITKANPTITFTSASSGTVGGTINLITTSNSPGAITYTVTNGTGTATVSGSVLSLTGNGTVTVTATQASSANYNGGTQTQVITISNLPAPTITFTSSNSGNVGATISIATSSNSTGAITYSVSNGTGSATLVGNVLTLTAAGTVTVIATQAADANFTSGTQTQVITIGKGTPSITITSSNSGAVGSTHTILATSTSTGTLSYQVTNGTGTALISGNQVNLLTAGTITITVNQTADANYNAGSQTQSFTITAGAPTLTITSANTGLVGGTISLTTSSNSTGAVTFSVVNGSGAANVVGSTLNLTGAGTVTVTANQAADANYSAASTSQVITIGKASPAITITSSNSGAVGAVHTITATSNSSGTFTYQITNGTGTATISGNQVTLVSAGTITITVNQTADANYNAGSQSQIFTIASGVPTLVITSASSGTVGTSINLSASSNSTGAITYSVVNGTGAASVSGSVLSLTGAGTVTVTATQAADANYAGTTATQVVTIGKATPTLTINSSSSGPLGSTIALSASSNSSGTISFTVVNGTGSASLTGNTLTLTGSGTVTVTANLAADANYTATSTTQVITIGKATPTLVFTSANTGVEGNTINLNASSSSTGAITYSVINGTGTASISGNVLTLLTEGTVTVTADQVADANYFAATTTQVITISKLNAVDESKLLEASMEVYPNPSNGIFTLKIATSGAPLKVMVYSGMGDLVWMNESVSEMNEINLSNFAAGVYSVTLMSENAVAVKKLTIAK